MPRTFELPDPGEGIHEAEIVELHVSAGDEVEESDILLEVETDKAVVEVPSPFSGRVEDVLVSVGTQVQVGEGVLTYEPNSEGGEAAPEPEDGEAATEPEEEEAATASESRDGDGEAAASQRPVPAAPATRRLARELDVDLRRVEGTGPGGRVLAEDVRDAAEEGEPAPETDASEPSSDEEPEEAPAREPAAEERRRQPGGEHGDPERWGPVTREPLRSVRRTTARRMADAWQRIPHVTHFDHADITDLEAFREEHADAMEEGDLSLTVFVLKALVAALKEFPRFNARLDEESGEIVLLDYHHVGVATDTERGLLVPVVRDVDAKSLSELSAELSELTRAVREGEVTREQMRGGSFTLTNPGPLGGDAFTPIINPPQVSILGVARATLQPVVRETGDGPTVEPRLILPLCLAFDHRVNDGADAARFVSRLVEILEDPDDFVRHL